MTKQNTYPDPSFKHLVIFVSLVLSAIYAFRYVELLQTGQAIFAEDFEVFYRSSAALLSGSVGGVYHVDPHPFVNPPFFLFYIAPLAALPHDVALALWYAAQTAIWAWVLSQPDVRAWWPNLSQSKKQYAALCFFVSLPFALNTILSGQTGFLIASLLLYGATILKRRPFLSGCVFALLTYKVQLLFVPLIIMFFYGRWRALVGFSLTLAGLMLVATICFGADIWFDYYAANLRQAEIFFGATPQRVLEQMASIFAALQLIGMPHQTAMIVQILVTLAFVGVFTYLCWRRPFSPRHLALMAIGIFLCSAYIFVYDMLIISVALFLMLDRQHDSALMRVSILLALAIPFVGVQLHYSGVPYVVITLLTLIFIASHTNSKSNIK